MTSDELTPLQQVYIDFAHAGYAVAIVVACLLAVVLGMAFVRGVWL
jgi:hypothetical protein